MARKQPIRKPVARTSRPQRRLHSSRSQSTQTHSCPQYSLTKKIQWQLKSLLKQWYAWQAPREKTPHSHVALTAPSFSSSPIPRPPRRPVVTVVSVTLSLLLTAGITLAAWQSYELIFKDLPQPSELTTRDQNLTTKIMDRQGQVLYEVFEDENRVLVPLDRVPSHVLQATMAIEDQGFREHHGLDIRGILRAFRSNSQGQNLQGGSTITQQLVKLRLLNSEKTLLRKAREAVLAVLVESTYSKDEILEMYLNEVAYGGYTYGIEAAAQRYFGKPVQELSLSEAAFLAGLPAAPSLYNPFGPTPELAQARQAEVLRRMAEDGYITPEQAAIAQTEPLTFVPEQVNIKAPHFVMYIKKVLAEQYGEDMIQTGGLEVTTSLDLALQEAAQQNVTDEVAKLNRLNITNGAGLITNPKTGEILAMVGSVDYFDVERDGQVNVTLRERQPGSSIKPLTYAIALERGFTPASLLDDTPVQFVSPGSEPYAPKNYDGQFHGKVTLRTSLASSYNIPAVRLLNAIGITTLIDKAQAMGITTWQDRRRFGLSLTLGGGEVKMTELAQIYGTLANQGETVTLNPILEVKNQQGQVLYRNDCALDKGECGGKQTLDSRVAYQVTSILSDNQARSPAFGLHSVLHIPNQQVAVKTGTTNNRRDNWTIGYTTDRVAAVWVGNNDNSEMSYVASGITGASPIWNDLIRLTLDDKKPHAFVPVPGLVAVSLCGSTANGGCYTCQNGRTEYFIPGTEPRGGCVAGAFSSNTNRTSRETLQSRGQRDQILEGVTTQRETQTINR